MGAAKSFNSFRWLATVKIKRCAIAVEEPMTSRTRATLAIAFCSLLLLRLAPSTAFAQTAREIAKRAFGSTVLLVMEDANDSLSRSVAVSVLVLGSLCAFEVRYDLTVEAGQWRY
jgi:hypothetical protein